MIRVSPHNTRRNTRRDDIFIDTTAYTVSDEDLVDLLNDNLGSVYGFELVGDYEAIELWLEHEVELDCITSQKALLVESRLRDAKGD